eukprot:TRINITY_DN23296_c0_g1_i1.p1 TRINITY_DN23296_c0_g1~~TRINITY_DN23296_c0_g1_i1.p1  ORF type:complete len:292 (+),score=30.82 TRINITY_DN23296_c0_g1_i1:90-878(+)
MLLLAALLCLSETPSKNDQKDDLIQLSVEVLCSSEVNCTGITVDLPTETAGVEILSIEYMTFGEDTPGWEYGIDLVCYGHQGAGPDMRLCGTEPGRLPCATRYPPPVFACGYGNYDTSWTLLLTANATRASPAPLVVSGVVWICTTDVCEKGRDLSPWKKPVMWVGISLGMLILGTVLYRRCILSGSGGQESRSSQASSLTVLWHANHEGGSKFSGTWNSRTSSGFADSRYSTAPPQIPNERSSIIPKTPKLQRGGISTTAL